MLGMLPASTLYKQHFHKVHKLLRSTPEVPGAWWNRWFQPDQNQFTWHGILAENGPDVAESKSCISTWVLLVHLVPKIVGSKGLNLSPSGECGEVRLFIRDMPSTQPGWLRNRSFSIRWLMMLVSQGYGPKQSAWLSSHRSIRSPVLKARLSAAPRHEASLHYFTLELVASLINWH